MNIFKNKSGQTIFSIDDQGNVSMTGNLFVGGNIDRVLETAFEVVRTPEGMAAPFEGAGEVICYLGETTAEYTHGSLWEKVPVGYYYEVDPTSNIDPAFSVAGQGSGTIIPRQSYNDVIYPYLQLFPNTTKVIIEAADKGLASRVWDIHFYDKNDNLLYTEETNQSLFENISDTIYFAPTYTDDLTVDFTVEMAVTPQCELVPLDGASYVPVTGGEFTGTLVTRDLLPSTHNSFSLGSSSKKYRKGWFIDIETGNISANSVDAQDIQINSNHQVVAGDSIVVAESASGHYAARRGLVFDGETRTKFLSKAGTWENAPSEGGGSGTPVVIGDVEITVSGEVVVTGIDNIIAPNIYNIVDEATDNVKGILEVWFDGQEYIQNVYPKYDSFSTPNSFVLSFPDKIKRHGEPGYWSSWYNSYNTGKLEVSRFPGIVYGNAGAWYTLTSAEWHYLIYERTDAENLLGFATVAGVKGLMLLKDNADLPLGAQFTPADLSATPYNFTDNVYTAAEWKKYNSKVLFLPLAGKREGSATATCNEHGYYWEANIDVNAPVHLSIDTTEVREDVQSYRYLGFSVRLVQAVSSSSSSAFSVAADKKVIFSSGNLQYHCTNKVWRFAKQQYDIIGTYNNGIDEGYEGWIDLFGFCTHDTPTLHTTTNTDYSLIDLRELPEYDWGYTTIYKVDTVNRIDCMGEDY